MKKGDKKVWEGRGGNIKRHGMEWGEHEQELDRQRGCPGWWMAEKCSKKMRQARREEGGERCYGVRRERGGERKHSRGTRARDIEKEVEKGWYGSEEGHLDTRFGAVPVEGCCSRHSAASPHLHPWSPGRRCSWAGGDRGWDTAVGAMIPLALGIHSVENG